ncbi:uncharacterized protein LOC133876444 isoform X2 [Alnus glutinosa]|uniref:uncharacterized protein LOC133876444 isoform X2 n=1 Tax=Alnus glutinosa TaxID=3517 RepID=UPI002D794961|nr:uncharacterized protein LOC133876444 isoform X2 [Alnus glutinosa]
MDQDDQTQKCSSSSGGGGGGSGRSSKKPKQKKAPQRGLGVAQLEKIRLEEQQKKDSAVILSPPPPSVSPTKSPFVSLPIPNYHHSNPSPSSNIALFPSPSPADSSSPNLMIRPPQPVQQNILVRNSATGPLTTGFDAGWSGISVPGVDPGLAFRSNLNLPYESDNPIWPPTGLMMPRTQQYLQPSHSMVNVSSGTSSSSVLNFRMEPPSNQSSYSNFAPVWPEEEKMVGMKRSYPFSLENPPSPSFNFNLPDIVAPIRSDESASCGNEATFNFDGSNTIFRKVRKAGQLSGRDKVSSMDIDPFIASCHQHRRK